MTNRPEEDAVLEDLIETYPELRNRSAIDEDEIFYE